MKKILVCGSYAYDTIMNFNDKFKHHIIQDKIHMLNISFLVPTMRKEYGGCAGNITYNLNLLSANVLPVATVGDDFTNYNIWLKKYNINTKYIKTISNSYTGQAFITTDIDNNQITAFHPGAMNYAEKNTITNITADIAIIAPDGKIGMLEHAKDLYNNNVPFIFDPGQGITMFNKKELLLFIQQATWLILNDYEAEMLVKITQTSIEKIAKQLTAVIITKGAKGSVLILTDKTIKIKAVAVKNIIDPTGCGDSYRAGILFGLVNNLSWQQTTNLASLIASIKITHHGTQNHTFSLSSIKDIYLQTFNEPLNISA